VLQDCPECSDRSALAFAFFLATLRRDSNLADKVVILDDPSVVRTGSGVRPRSTSLHGLAEDCDQVVVLSTTHTFLNAVEQDTQTIGIARLQTSAVGDAVELSPCDLGQSSGARLLQRGHRLSAYVSAGQGTPLDIARAIRPVLEGHLRQQRPAHSTE